LRYAIKAREKCDQTARDFAEGLVKRKDVAARERTRIRRPSALAGCGVCGPEPLRRLESAIFQAIDLADLVNFPHV
jgi:hypothetical protein